MSSLDDFMNGPVAPAEPEGTIVDISMMCDCGNSALVARSTDKFKTAHAVCDECGRSVKVTIPAWLRELL